MMSRTSMSHGGASENKIFKLRSGASEFCFSIDGLVATIAMSTPSHQAKGRVLLAYSGGLGA